MSDARNSSGRPRSRFYPVFTLGLIAFVVISGVVLLGRLVKGDAAPSTPDALNSGNSALSTLTSKPGGGEFHSQRRDIHRTDETEEARTPALEIGAIRRLEEALVGAGTSERRTAAALKRFAGSGEMAELRAINREDVVALADYLSRELSPAEAGTLLHRFLGLPVESVQTAEDVRSAAVEVFDAVAGNRMEEVRPSVLVVTDGADVDGRITGHAHVLPAGTERVYAVFENAQSLAGLGGVLAVWRNPSDDRMVFTEFEPIRQGSAYNYVWLESKTGWPEGQYQVELFHPEAQSLLLASETFSVR